MSNNETNIKSSTVEKGLELAKDFLGKLIFPTIEEVGLLISDNIKFYRFKNQVRILLKAREYVEQKNIQITEIPIKILVPLLENASLEVNEDLQDKWAKMITNMANSEENFQNQIFPYLLSQISIQEFDELKELSLKEKHYWELRKYYWKLREEDKYALNKETKQAAKDFEIIDQNGFRINLEGYEISNLQRLALIKQLPPRIIIEEFKTGNNSDYSSEVWHSLDVAYDNDDFGFRITELGEMFLDICDIK